eukprot:2902353-Pyramimonas_sp.AAC.1
MGGSLAERRFSHARKSSGRPRQGEPKFEHYAARTTVEAPLFKKQRQPQILRGNPALANMAAPLIAYWPACTLLTPLPLAVAPVPPVASGP